MRSSHQTFAACALVVALMGVARAGAYDDFFVALRTDDVTQIQQLLARGFDPNTPDESHRHPLMVAIQSESLQAALLLIRAQKVNLNQENAVGETPLMLAALRGHGVLVDALLKQKAHVNKTGWTALHYASTSAHLNIMQQLLQAHAYIDAESPNGSTPLMMAVRYGNDEAVKLLIEEGADPTLKNQQGLTALDFATGSSKTSSAKLIEQASMVLLNRARRP